MGIMTGDTGHFPVFCQREDDVEVLFHHFHTLQSLGWGRLGHMVKIVRVLSFKRMAPPAKGPHVSDEGHFTVGCGFFKRFFLVAVQTHLNVKRAIGLDLKMRVQLLIFFSVVTDVTEIRFPGVGRSPQHIPAEQAFYTLPIDMVAGVASESPVSQREIGRYGQFLVQFRVNIQRVAVAPRHAAMTPTEDLVVAVVFQIDIAPFYGCSFMAQIAILSGVMYVGSLSDDGGPRC